MEGLVKLVMTSYRQGELSGGFGETSYDQLDLEKCQEGLVKLVVTS